MTDDFIKTFEYSIILTYNEWKNFHDIRPNNHFHVYQNNVILEFYSDTISKYNLRIFEICGNGENAFINHWPYADKQNISSLISDYEQYFSYDYISNLLITGTINDICKFKLKEM